MSKVSLRITMLCWNMTARHNWYKNNRHDFFSKYLWASSSSLPGFPILPSPHSTLYPLWHMGWQMLLTVLENQTTFPSFPCAYIWPCTWVLASGKWTKETHFQISQVSSFPFLFIWLTGENTVDLQDNRAKVDRAWVPGWTPGKPPTSWK